MAFARIARNNAIPIFYQGIDAALTIRTLLCSFYEPDAILSREGSNAHTPQSV